MQNLPDLKKIEESIGGRPKSKSSKKARLSFYISEKDVEKLKSLAVSRDIPVSGLVRELVQKEIL